MRFVQVLSQQVRVLQPTKVNISFTNPLSTAVSGVITIEGAGIRDAIKVPVETVCLLRHVVCIKQGS